MLKKTLGLLSLIRPWIILMTRACCTGIALNVDPSASRVSRVYHESSGFANPDCALLQLLAQPIEITNKTNVISKLRQSKAVIHVMLIRVVCISSYNLGVLDLIFLFIHLYNISLFIYSQMLWNAKRTVHIYAILIFGSLI